VGLPGATAHGPPNIPLPNQFCGNQATHHYTTGTSLRLSLPIVQYANWRTTVQLMDSCPYDGEGDYGIGGGFLPIDHHGSYDPFTNTWSITACVDDDMWGPAAGNPFAVGLIIGVNVGGGNIVEYASGNGCATATAPDLGFGITQSADFGWWVFLENRNIGTILIEPTNGHLYSL
jgi:hypothetical protein